MIAFAFAVCYTGAMPVFVDAVPDTWNIDADKMEDKITAEIKKGDDRVKAIMPVPIYGHPCDMDSIMSIAKRYGLYVVEDAAEIHGAEYKGRKAGSFGDINAFSFYANKNLTTGEGSMVVTDKKELYDRVRYFKNLCFPLDSPRSYMHEDIGFNYRMSNLHAAIGLAQLEKADEYRTMRIRNAWLYQSLLADVPGLIEAVTVYTSTRGVYGSVEKLPVSEDAPTNPKGLYEISNLTAEKIINFYGEIHKLKVVNLRLSNIYGERAQMRHSKFGVVNWFVRLAIEDGTIKVFGDGKILRDFLYVDDCVDAILAAGGSEKAYGGTFNVGNDRHCSFLELVTTILEVASSGKWEYAPFTKERAAQEPGDFYPDITKITKTIGWKPNIPLEEGLLRTVEFYRTNKSMYW